MIGDHLDDVTLDAYIDGELAATERAAAEAHIAGCPLCRRAADSLGGISHTIAGTLPSEDTFCNEGVFWERLASRLDQAAKRRGSDSLLVLLPPLLLGAFGLLLTGAAWLASIVVLLVGLGAIPPLRTMFADLAASQAASAETPILVGWMLQALWWGLQALTMAANSWPAATRAMLQVGLIYGMVAAGLIVLLALLAVWALCVPDTLLSGRRTDA